LIDGWPQISDAVVDYYHQKKLAYHYIKRAQESVLIIIGESQRWKHPVVLCNDSLEFLDVAYWITDFDKDTVIQEGTVRAKPNENTELPEIPSIPGEQKLYLIEWEIAGKKYGSHYTAGFAPFNLEKYQVWLEAIAKLPGTFDPADCYL
jgi:beta-mannosidase